MSDTLVSTHPLNHGRIVVKNVIRFVKYAEHVFVIDAWVNRFPTLVGSGTACAGSVGTGCVIRIVMGSCHQN